MNKFLVRPLISSGIHIPHEIFEADSPEDAIRKAEKKHRRLFRYLQVSEFTADIIVKDN